MSLLPSIPLLIMAAVVVVEAGRAIGAVRRARRLNRAMHELRRPLQSLGLLLERGDADLGAARACMEQARSALAELDAVINGRVAAPRPRGGERGGERELGEVLAALQARWRAFGVKVDPAPRGPAVPDIRGLGAALDNLVANALEHGAAPVSVRVRSEAAMARIEVRDAGAAGPWAFRRRDPRRGHGLDLVRDYAAGSGGSASLRVGPHGAGTAATIRIPVERSPAGAGGETAGSGGEA